MDMRIVIILVWPLLLAIGTAFAGPVTGKPDPVHGQDLAERL